MKKIFFILFLFSAKMCISQTAATNTGILYITGSSDIFFAGNNFSNNSGAALSNNGQLYIKGNLVNDQSAMTIGTGTLFLNGNTTQVVSGSQPFSTWHLNTNNAAGITLNNNLEVSGVHTFTAGILTTSATPNYLVYQAGASYTGDGDSRHVNGWVKKFGSTNFIFPVGNATLERTVELNGLSANSEFNAKYFPNTPNSFTTQLPLREADWMEYWSINKVSGGSASVKMNWDNSKVYFPHYILSDIVAAGYNGSIWSGIGGSATGNVSTTGTITSNSVSSFNLFTFGSTSWVLPLTLLDFTATRQDHYTQISWTTEKENNSSHFLVERSDDGSAFYTVTRVAARNSGHTETYTARDNAAIQHVAYYRLRSVDIDGRETFSRVIAVTDGSNINQLLLVNNPVYDKIILLATGQVAGEFNYQLSLINGQLVQQGTLSIQNGGRYEIPLKSKLLPAIYSLKVLGHSQTFYFKVMIR